MSRPEVIDPMHRPWERFDSMADEFRRMPTREYGKQVCRAVWQVVAAADGSDVKVPLYGCGITDKSLYDDWSEM